MRNILVAASVNLELSARVNPDDARVLIPEVEADAAKRVLGWGSFNRTVAGSSYNVIRALTRSGIASAKLLATIGPDVFGTLIRDLLVEEGIDHYSLIWRDQTSVAMNIISPGDRRPNLLSLNWKGAYRRDHLEEKLGEIESQVQKLSPGFRIGTGVQHMDAPLIKAMFGTIRNGDGDVIQSTNVLNPGLSLITPSEENDEGRRQQLLELLQRTSILVVNHIELEKLLDSMNAQDVPSLRKLIDNPSLEVLVTREEKGAIYHNGDAAPESLVIPAFTPRQIVDPTGAGDCFLGNYIAGLAKGNNKKEALRFASGAAALAVERFGGSDMPTEQETSQFIASAPQYRGHGRGNAKTLLR